MHRLRSLWILATLLIALGAPAVAATEQDAARLMQRGDFAEAAQAYAALVQQNPKSLRLRLDLADALAKDRQWQQAIAEYQAVLKLAPNNAEALLGLATVHRWRGHLPEARQTYGQARTLAPNDPAATLGLAAVAALDHDQRGASAFYDHAERRWPGNDEVRQAAYDFRRQVNPRVYLYYEDDLSFRTEIGGLSVPLLAREELGAEYQKETRFAYLTGVETYARSDAKLLYTHFFGLNHALDFSARQSEYTYPVLPTAFAAIDRFQEYRLRYSMPIVPKQVVAVRYTARPTTLLNRQDFVAHKIEAELVSQWLPRIQTTVGAGWLRDLDENAVTISDMTSQALLKLGFQYDITNRLDVSGRFITNPDLDSSVNSTTIVQAGYSFTGSFGLLVRGRFDDYKSGDDQNSVYAALRYTPFSHLWSEVGVKHVQRGSESGFYPLVSAVWRF